MKKSPLFSSNLLVIVILFILFTTLAISFTLHFSLSPVDPSQTHSISFSIDPGENLDSIAKRLQENRLIRNQSAFKFAVVFQGLAKNIQAGNFQLSPQMSSFQIAQALTHSQDEEVQITLLEGWRREEYAQALTQAFSQFADSQFNPDEFLQLTQEKEGYLYPDTYRFSPRTTTSEVVATLTTTFDQKVVQGLDPLLTTSSLSLKDIVILASIVEREARGEARPIVAGILLKRLQNNWPLQADATLQYLKANLTHTNDWWPTPLAADKEIQSPFNTYQHPGLPPSPICNPSLNSIQAVLSPQKTDYWYYISDPEGNMHYAQTHEEHLHHINTYLR